MSDKRLIDANALGGYISDWQMSLPGDNRPDWNNAAYDTLEDVLEAIKNAPTIDPETLRSVAHWEDVPGSYKDHIGKDGSWFVPTTRCTNPECREINPCSLKTPFCPMCGFRMEDVPYDVD